MDRTRGRSTGFRWSMGLLRALGYRAATTGSVDFGIERDSQAVAVSTQPETIQCIADPAGLGRRLTSRRMFGEYALYVDGKVVSLIGDDQLFLKPTPEGRRELEDVTEAPPYPGAKSAAARSGRSVRTRPARKRT
jgi:hypothetical protein